MKFDSRTIFSAHSTWYCIFIPFSEQFLTAGYCVKMLRVRFEHPKEWQILGILRYGQQAHSPIRRYIKETPQVKTSALGCVFLCMVFYIYGFNL